MCYQTWSSSRSVNWLIWLNASGSFSNFTWASVTAATTYLIWVQFNRLACWNHHWSGKINYQLSVWKAKLVLFQPSSPPHQIKAELSALIWSTKWRCGHKGAACHTAFPWSIRGVGRSCEMETAWFVKHTDWVGPASDIYRLNSSGSQHCHRHLTLSGFDWIDWKDL